MSESLWSFEGMSDARPRTAHVSTSGHVPPLTLSAVIAAGVHLFPFRTEKLSPPAPMVLGARAPGRVGRRRISSREGRREAPFSACPNDARCAPQTVGAAPFAPSPASAG